MEIELKSGERIRVRHGEGTTEVRVENGELRIEKVPVPQPRDANDRCINCGAYDY